VIETESALLPAVAGYVRVNSDVPSAAVAVGVVETMLINASAGVIPTTGFPNASVTLTLCLTRVDVNGLAFGV
jgi:hypothetical protein